MKIAVTLNNGDVIEFVAKPGAEWTAPMRSVFGDRRYPVMGTTQVLLDNIYSIANDMARD